jgi:alkylation response protein AidB-like acyl-CoA dehydrogenase
VTNLEVDIISPQEIGALARRILSEKSKRRDPLEVGAAKAGEEMWRTAAELGWFLLTIPEEREGLGQNFSVLGSLYTELGRALSPLPLLNSMLAVEVLGRAGTASVPGLLEAVGTGEAVIAIQIPGTKAVSARPDGDDLVLSGELDIVAFPANATHLVFVVDVEGEVAIAVLPCDGLGERSVVRETWDRTREIASVNLNGLRMPRTALTLSGNNAREALKAVQSHFDLAIGCDSLGGAETILTETVEYTKTRRQFGREIGSFQALKHRCADMKTWLAAARAPAGEAVNRRAEGDLDSPLAAAAKFYACEIYKRIAMDSVQIHGGIGFTWEQDCHLFLKRALLNEQLGGSPSDYQDRLFEPLSALVGARQIAGVQA